MRKLYCFSLLLLLVAFPAKAESDLSKISWTQVTTEPAFNIDWDSTGERIAIANYQENTVGIFNLPRRSYDSLFSLPDDSVARFIRWSPDGTYLAATVEGDIYLFDVEDNLNEDYQVFSSDFGYYGVVRWSADSSRLAALTFSGYIEILDILSGEVSQTIELGELPEIVYPTFDWSPDGQIFAAPYYRTLPFASEGSLIGFWDAEGHLINDYIPQNQTEFRSGDFCYNYGEGNGEAFSIEWASDGKSLAISGYDGYGICILDVEGIVEQNTISSSFNSIIRWSPDQHWLASATQGGTGAWSCFVSLVDMTQDYRTTEEALSRENCAVISLAWSPDSTQLAAGTSSGLWIGTLIN
ncbi:MAG: hypothetical protein ABI835_06975 [Chloroflexota bacterium]